MTLGATLSHLERRSAVRARADERLATIQRVEAVLTLRLPRLAGHRSGLGLNHFLGQRDRRPSAKQLLLDAMLLAHPLLQRNSDRIRNREYFVRAESNRVVVCDAAQLAMH